MASLHRLTAAFRTGLHLPGQRDEAADAPAAALNPWIRIRRDGIVTVVVDKAEMGQGVLTALPMLVAEELEVPLSQVQTEFAPVDPVYANTMLGTQVTGGSTSIRSSWALLRFAGAAAREMLITAAAQRWEVPRGDCHAEGGAVLHNPSGRRLGYGVLAPAAAALPVPQSVPLKEPGQFRIIGKPAAALDGVSKVTGATTFGIDVKVPNMLVAVVERCPVFGGQLASFDPGPALAVDGVHHVVRIESGVAVVAAGFWHAQRGREALSIQWEEGPLAALSSGRITRLYRAAARQPAAVARNEGDVEAAFTRPRRKLEAVYEVPYLAHAVPEPLNCTAHVREDRCEVWVGTQAPAAARDAAAKAAGLNAAQVQVHCLPLGGGFGRRLETDFVVEAVQIAKAVGAPVQVVWSRADDLQHDFYRPATYNRLRAALDKDGVPIGWMHRIVGPSILARENPEAAKAGMDSTSVEGAADLPYDIPNIRVDYVMQDPWVPVGAWRSVGHSQNAFVVECFLDEIAAARNRDPCELRHELLNRDPRHQAVLELAATRAGWGEPLPAGVGRGVATHACYGSYVAQVAEVRVGPEGDIRVLRVVCAIDCGIAVNPDGVVAQMEGAIVFGLSAALKNEITIRDGRVVQRDVHEYPALRMHEVPVIEVHIVESHEAPGGVGEPGVPPVAPAVANAIYAATGKRLRRLPIRQGSIVES
jgi:isoquinoline 1-oxidoreductase subunit beta